LRDEPKKILVVEDEPNIRSALKAYLENAGYAVTDAGDGESGLRAFAAGHPDLVVLDLMLPKIPGERVCEEIRRVSRVPIIMLTAKSGEDDKIAGFSIGADDYLTKPFSPRELIARIGSLFRRCSEGVSPLYAAMSWNDGDLEIDFESRVIKKQGVPVPLTPNEFKILSSLVKYPQKIFTRDELINLALGDDFDGFERTIDSHVKNLRGKIEDDSANPKYILTVRGVGYKFGGASAERRAK
jgi:DNA-binding response OmpR family regulator